MTRRHDAPKFVRNRQGLYRQFAALPVIQSSATDQRVLLITSRDTGRWVLPKGWPMPGKRGSEVAAIEAYEEAGILGTIMPTQVGTYRYDKVVADEILPCEVEVFVLRADGQLSDWPERLERETCWFSCGEAARMVQEEDLAEILIRVSGMF